MLPWTSPICNTKNGKVWLTTWSLFQKQQSYKTDAAVHWNLYMQIRWQEFSYCGAIREFCYINAKLFALCKVFTVRISPFPKTQLAHHKIIDYNLITILLWNGVLNTWTLSQQTATCQVRRTNFSVSSDFILNSMVDIGMCHKWIVLCLSQFVTSGNLSSHPYQKLPVSQCSFDMFGVIWM